MTTAGSAPGQLDATTSENGTTPDASVATPLERDRHLAIKVRVCLLESSFFQRLGVTRLLSFCVPRCPCDGLLRRCHFGVFAKWPASNSRPCSLER